MVVRRQNPKIYMHVTKLIGFCEIHPRKLNLLWDEQNEYIFEAYSVYINGSVGRWGECR